MRHWISLVFAGLMCTTLLTGTPALGSEFYVSPKGNDAHGGTKKAPFRTIERAREEVRKKVAAGLREPVTVFLQSGVYELGETLTFGPEDSGTERHSISYQAAAGEKVVLSGGRRITGWTKGEGSLWRVAVPGVKESTWYPRQLWVNEARRPRARTPNQGAFFRGIRTQDAQTLSFPPGQLAARRNAADAEIVVLVEWTPSRHRVGQVNVPANSVTFPRKVLQFWDLPWAGHIRNNTPNQPYYFENAVEMLDAPGEWYLDRGTGELLYWPAPGESPAVAQAVLPRLNSLIRILGKQDHPVRNVRFVGLTLSHTDWPLPAEGFMPSQAGFSGPTSCVSAAIHMEYANACQVQDCRLLEIGTTGVSLGIGCRGCVVIGCEIADVSANGIEVGHHDSNPKDPRDTATDNVIANNYLHHGGLDYCGCVAVCVGITEHTVVSHNLISHWPYTGVSVGWNWTRAATACKRNIVEYNHIHHVMQRLADGGGVYMLGTQPGSVLRGNHIHDVELDRSSGARGNNGVFLDEGSNGWRIEDNVIYGVANGGVVNGPIRHNNNRPEDHSWGTNYLDPKASEKPEIVNEIKAKAGLEVHYRERLEPKMPKAVIDAEP